MGAVAHVMLDRLDTPSQFVCNLVHGCIGFTQSNARRDTIGVTVNAMQAVWLP